MDLATIGVLLLTACLYWMYRKYTSIREPPEPPGLTSWGDAIKFLNEARKFTLHFSVEKWARQYGDLMCMNVFGKRIVIINEVQLMKKLLCDENYRLHTNDRPPSFYGNFIMNEEDIGSSPVGEHHTRMRKQFHNSLRIYGDGVQAFEDTITQELRHVVQKIASMKDVNLGHVVSHSLLNVLHILMMNKRPSENSEIYNAMIDFNNSINEFASLENDLPLTMMPLLRYLPGRYRRMVNETQANMKRLFHLTFDEMKASYVRGKPSGLIQAAMETDMQEKHIKLLVADIIAAGYLTTKGFLIGILISFIEQPKIQEKLYNYIKAELGNRQAKVKDKSKLPYVEAVIFEAIRYMALSPLAVPRFVTKDIDVNGYRIRKDSVLLTNMWYMNHNEKIYENPWTFQPERFLDDDGQLLPPEHPTRQWFSPFGVGRRQCPGEVFAKTRLFLFITTLVQHFKFLPPEGGMTSSSDTRTWSPGILLQSKPTFCRVELRDPCPLLNSAEEDISA